MSLYSSVFQMFERIIYRATQLFGWEHPLQYSVCLYKQFTLWTISALLTTENGL